MPLGSPVSFTTCGLFGSPHSHDCSFHLQDFHISANFDTRLMPLTRNYFKVTPWSGDALLNYGFRDDDSLLTAAHSGWLARRGPRSMYFDASSANYVGTFLITVLNAGTDYAYAEVCLVRATHRRTGVTYQVHRINTPPSGQRDLSITPPHTRRGSQG